MRKTWKPISWTSWIASSQAATKRRQCAGHIKADGSRRPLGIPSFEDKLAQRAIVMVLEAVYEQGFLPCSFGFRPGRSAHQALQSLHTAIMGRGLRWVIDIDIVNTSILSRTLNFETFLTGESRMV